MNISKHLKILRFVRSAVRSFHDVPSPNRGKLTASPLVLEALKDRELIRVKGNEVIPFLQGLVTNDVTRLQSPESPGCLYAMFLNKSGRLLYDTIIYRTNDPETYLIECDSSASAEFRRHLRTYRVRRKIDVDTVEDEYMPYVVFTDNKPAQVRSLPNAPELFVTADPRLPALGTRILAPNGMPWSKIASSFWRSNESQITAPSEKSNYRRLRYKLGVAEGVGEMPPGKCFPLEANGDLLHGISFNKGCYVGQELTARIHHSGVIRKRYMPLRLTAPVNPPLTVKSIAGANLGTVFGQETDRGVGLLRIEQVINGQQELVIDGDRCYAEKPTWWPVDLPLKRRISV